MVLPFRRAAFAVHLSFRVIGFACALAIGLSAATASADEAAQPTLMLGAAAKGDHQADAPHPPQDSRDPNPPKNANGSKDPPASPNDVHDPQFSTQFKPETPIRKILSVPPGAMADIHFAIAIVPDPRVPRHRRTYDNAITAIVQGMLQAEHVLDQYSFPWQEQLRTGKARESDVSEDRQFGLMLFRRDAWRYGTVPAQQWDRQVTALYVVPETGTYGAQSAAFSAAIEKINSQELVPCPGVITVFGPTFSGSLDSVARAVNDHVPAEKLPCPYGKVAVQSSTATAESNSKVNKQPDSRLQYSSLATDDRRKLEFLELLRTQLGVPTNRIALFYETTVFGLDICPRASPDDKLRALCNDLSRVPFPANIADIRFGLHQHLEQRRIEVIDPLLKKSDHLALEDDAENGNEFPDSYQSRLTAVSNQLDLDMAIATVSRIRPRIVVVVATDIRDRLFLFEQLRAKMPNVLFVDLETDRLLAHPTYVNVSRGALTLSSSELKSKDEGAKFTSTWSTDRQALLAYAICSAEQSSTGPIPVSCPSPRDASGDSGVHLHVVTRKGLRSAADTTLDVLPQHLVGEASDWIALAALLISILACSLWIGWRPAPLPPLARLVLLFVFVPVLFARDGTFFVALALCVLVTGGLSLLASTYFRISTTMNEEVARKELEQVRSRWNWLLLPALFIFLLVGLFGIEIWHVVSRLFGNEDPQVRLLQRALTSDAAAGLAYSLAIAVAAATLLYALAACRTYIVSAQRNRFVLMGLHGVKVVPQYTVERLGDPTWPIAGTAALLLMGLVVGFAIVDGARLTVFGPEAAVAAYAALMSASIVSMVTLVAAIYVASRIHRVCTAAEPVLVKAAAAGDKRLFSWEGVVSPRPHFGMTPILASVVDGGECIKSIPTDIVKWRDDLKNLSERDLQKRAAAARALYTLLASSMTLYRWCVFGCAGSVIAAATMVYLFPVTDADILLLLNLGVLLVIGVHSGFTTMRYESDELLSNVLCNQEKQMKFSYALFGFVAFPFILLMVAIAITQIPGVLNWSGGILDLLIQTTRPAILKGG